MGRRRKYLINAYTRSLHLNTDSFTHPIVFIHFFLYFLLRTGTVYSFSLSHAYSKKYLSVACIYKESVVGVCVQLACLPHCLNVLHWVSQGPACPFSSCAFGTFVYFSCDLG